MVRFLFVSRRTETSLQVKRELEQNPHHTVDFVETAKAAMERIQSGKVDYLLFNFDHLSELQIKLVEDAVTIGKVFQVFILTDKISPESEVAIKKLKNVMAFERHTINVGLDMTGLCQRIVEGQETYPRKSKRYPTKQRGRIEHQGVRRPKINVTMGNLSHQGALVEYQDGVLEIGDSVKLFIELDKLQRTRKVIAKVMWVHVVNSKKKTAGLRFIREDAAEDVA